MAKKALITSGGGAKGAFTVGALKCLKQKGVFPFDIISGTSTGSLIAALAAADRLDILEDEYTNVQPDDVLTKQNIVNNLLRARPFLFDTTPLHKLITRHVTQQVFDQLMLPTAPTLCLTAVSLQTGIPTVFSNKDLSQLVHTKYNVCPVTTRQELIDALLASGSQAGFLPPVLINGEQFVDGGHREVIPTQVAVDLQPDEVYVLSNNPTVQFEVQKQYDDILQIILRAISIFVQDVRENDYKVLDDYCRTNNIRKVIIEPRTDLDEENPTGLNFNPIAMAGWMIQGEQRARLKLESQEGPVPPLFV